MASVDPAGQGRGADTSNDRGPAGHHDTRAIEHSAACPINDSLTRHHIQLTATAADVIGAGQPVRHHRSSDCGGVPHRGRR